MTANVGIIDDNETSQKVLTTMLSEIEIEEKISLNIFNFFSPIEYVLQEREFDLLILDSLFKSYPLNLNSLGLSKIAKERNSNTKVILISEYANEDFLKLISNKTINYYTSRRIEEDKMKKFLKLIIEEVERDKKNLLKQNL